MEAAIGMRDGVLGVAGEMDLYVAEELRQALAELLGGDGPPRVDVSAAEGWDLSCLQLLYAARRTAGEQGRRLSVEGAGEALAAACRAIGTDAAALFEGGC